MLIIDHTIDICGFSEDSTMAEFIKQQAWTELSDVVTISLEEVADFRTLKDDGSYKAKPLAHHVRKLKGFLLFYNRQCQEL
jgi:predicted amino acid racemase